MRVARTLLGTGVFGPTRPDKLLRALAVLRRWGLTPPAVYGVAAILYPDRAAIIDELGTLTFAQVHRRTNALARSLRAAGINEGDGVAIMCRNHRGFVEATVACSKLGANVLYLDTAFAAPQITEVVRREDPAAVIYDEEFTDLVHGWRPGSGGRFLAWCDCEQSPRDRSLEELIAGEATAGLRPPGERGSVVIPASWSTPTPKGGSRRAGGVALASRSRRSPLRCSAPPRPWRAGGCGPRRSRPRPQRSF
jgi:acyl-coenzyme A synthetase/AMP-(fatty) acid ligase